MKAPYKSWVLTSKTFRYAVLTFFLILFRAEKGLKILMKEWWSGHFLSLSAWSLLDWHKFVYWNHFSVKRSHLKCTDIINRRCDFSLLFHFGYFVSLKEETSLCRNQAYKRLTEVTSQNTLHSSSSDAEIPHDFFQRFNSDSSTQYLKKASNTPDSVQKFPSIMVNLLCHLSYIV